MTAYLDNSATTPVCSEAVEAMKTAVTELWGNPSSLHQKGIEADEMLENARSNVARRLFCRDDEVYFTSGGTESNNLAVQGAAHAMRRRGRRIVTTSVEHPSIDETVKHLENEGFEVIRLGVDKNGRISERELFEAVTPDTILVSIMAVNNETGYSACRSGENCGNACEVARTCSLRCGAGFRKTAAQARGDGR